MGVGVRSSRSLAHGFPSPHPHQQTIQQPFSLFLNGQNVGADLLERAQRLRFVEMSREADFVADLGGLFLEPGIGGVGNTSSLIKASIPPSSSRGTGSVSRNSLIDQPTILVDPVISDLDNAVPLPLVRRLLERRLRVWPSRGETFCLITSSRLFGLTSVLCFGSQHAFDTVQALDSLPNQTSLDRLTLNGKNHLALLGYDEVDSEVLSQIESLLDRSLQRAAVPGLAAPPPLH